MNALLHRLHDFFSPFNWYNTFTVLWPTQRIHPPRPLPDLPLEIWLEIFQFATYVHRSATLRPLDPFTLKRTSTNAMGANTPALAMRTKMSLVLVSRSWRYVAVQMLYEHLPIRSPARADALLQVLEKSCESPESDSAAATRPRDAGYGQWTRHIEIYTYARGAKSITYLQTLFRIFQLCPNLRVLSGTWNHPLPVEFLNAISKIYGPSLEGLYWNEQAPDHPHNHITTSTPEFLATFRALRVLDLRHFVGSDPLTRSHMSLPTPTLPFVQDLILSTNPRCLLTAAILGLPSLRNLTLKTSINVPVSNDLLAAFLEVQGKSLITVDLPTPSPDFEPEPDSSQSRQTAVHVNPDVFLQEGVCPNLVSLTYPITSPQLAPHVHPCLRCIGLRGIRSHGLYPDTQSSTKLHLMAVTPSRYPNLEVVRTVGFLVEADTDGLIRDIFIWWAEKFEKHGIDFLDGEGVLWAYMEPEEGAEKEAERDIAIPYRMPASEPKAGEGEPLQKDCCDEAS